ncbi:hypothetical protein LINPERPRIM_LOCUS2222 [Linum perenne]
MQRDDSDHNSSSDFDGTEHGSDIDP